jgi:hypothetical protein
MFDLVKLALIGRLLLAFAGLLVAATVGLATDDRTPQCPMFGCDQSQGPQ